MSSTDVLIYVDVISKQTVHFFQSDTHTVIPNKLAFISLHCSITNYTLKGLRSDKPLHKRDPNKYQTKAFGPFVITNQIRPDLQRTSTKHTWFDRRIERYLISTNSTAPIRSCVRRRTQFFKIVGFTGKRFHLSPPPPPPPSFLLFCSCPSFLDDLARKRLLRRLAKRFSYFQGRYL